jgi:hypothetical protein
VQSADSVFGIAVLEYEGRDTEQPIDLRGAVKNGQLVLREHTDLFRLDGAIRNGRIDARVSVGDKGKANEFSISFARDR